MRTFIFKFIKYHTNKTRFFQNCETTHDYVSKLAQ